MNRPAPLIITKILCPRRRDDLLYRPRLVDFIHAHIDRKLILISAPAGYGKTSLLIDYAHNTDLPVCWYTLDENDSDPRVFLEYLVASIRRRFPEFGERTTRLLEAEEAALPDWETIVGALVNDMVEAIGEYFVIILDDYHLIPPESEVHALLDTLLRYLPEHCHIVLASRTLPPLTLTLLAARQEVDGLGMDDLRFTAEEIRALIRQNYDLEIPDEQAEELARESGGWISGLLLTRHNLWKGLFADMIRSQGEAQVFDYLANEVFQRQPSHVQRFLLGTAILDRMNPELCNALLEIEDARDILRYLETQNLFVIRLEGEGEWYQYHHLFQAFLRAYLKGRDPEEHTRLHLRAAQLFEAREQIAEAIQHYLEAAAYEEAAQAIVTIAEQTFRAGRWTMLARWIDALPREVQLQYPSLMVQWAKVKAQQGEVAAAIDALEEAVAQFRARGDDEKVADALVMQSVVLRFKGRYEKAIERCQEALQLVEEKNPLIAAAAYRNLGICRGLLGDLSTSVKELNRALELCRDEDAAYLSASIHHDLATTHYRSGALSEALVHYREALRYWKLSNNVAWVGETLSGMACALYYRGETEEALRLLEEALAYARETGYLRLQGWVLASLADLYRDAGSYEQALDFYTEALDIAERIGEESLGIYSLNALGIAQWMQERYAEARTLIAQAAKLAQQSGSNYEMGLCEDALGLVYMKRNDLQRAIRHFRQAVALFEACGARRDLAVALLHLGEAEVEQGLHDTALDALRQVLSLAEELGYDHFLVTQAPWVSELLKLGIKHNVEAERLTAVLEKIGEEAPVPVAEVEEPISEKPELRVQALGQAQVWLNGELITRKQWDSTTTKELFFFLLAHPEGVRKDEILEVFWPEGSPARASSAFHSTNYRLRRALKNQECVLYRDGVYLLNPDLKPWYDVEVFEDLIQRAERATSDEERIVLLEEAVGLYQGDYLEEFYSDWPYFKREELQRQYLQALRQLAQLYWEKEAHEKALNMYERIVARDPYQEEVHREIMRLYAETGQRAAAIKHYQRLEDFLREDLNVEPMPETQALYEAILNGHVDAEDEEEDEHGEE